MPTARRSLREWLSPHWPIWLRRVVNRSSPVGAGPEQEDLLSFLRSRAEWENLIRRAPHLMSPEHLASVAEQARRNGVLSRMLGAIPAEQVRVEDSNYRESFLAAGFNPRQRAVMDRLLDFSAAHDRKARLHLHEALTDFALLFRGRYPLALCSEYAGDAEAAKALFPIPIVDITASDLPSASFDVVLTQEVLEHVPDLDAALADMARILKPGGIVLGTFPFDPGADVTQVRAVLENGAVRHLAPPEYHGNPTDAEGGSLVFQLPAWDVLERAVRAGFSDARMVAIHSPARGIIATGMAPILVFEAQR